MAKMVSMKLKGDASREQKGVPMESIKPDYPWGLCINLGAEELDKLGMTKLPEVGTEMELGIKVTVTRVAQSASTSSRGTDEHREVGLQITDIEIEPDLENDEDD